MGGLPIPVVKQKRDLKKAASHKDVCPTHGRGDPSVARGRSKNAPTDKKLNRRKQRDNPDRFLGLSGFTLFCSTNWNLVTRRSPKLRCVYEFLFRA